MSRILRTSTSWSTVCSTGTSSIGTGTKVSACGSARLAGRTPQGSSSNDRAPAGGEGEGGRGGSPRTSPCNATRSLPALAILCPQEVPLVPQSSAQSSLFLSLCGTGAFNIHHDVDRQRSFPEVTKHRGAHGGNGLVVVVVQWLIILKILLLEVLTSAKKKSLIFVCKKLGCCFTPNENWHFSSEKRRDP